MNGNGAQIQDLRAQALQSQAQKAAAGSTVKPALPNGLPKFDKASLDAKKAQLKATLEAMKVGAELKPSLYCPL